MHKTDFGTIGLKIGDEIVFRKDKLKFIVASGDGTPENGGTLVAYPDGNFDHLYSLRYITRKILGNEFDKGKDIFELWEYEEKTLRSIYNINQSNRTQHFGCIK